MNIARAALICAIVAAPVLAAAGPRDELIAGMAKCAAVADATARLACYDALNPVVKAAQAEPPPAAAAPPAATETVDNRPWYSVDRIFGVAPRDQHTAEQFGGEDLAPPTPPPGTPATAANTAPPPPLDSIGAGVSEYSFTVYSKFIVILDNGQIWQQLQSDDGLAHFMKSGKNTVTITRGALGSYNMVINDASMIFKVKRLK
jgi:hypothetical protein